MILTGQACPRCHRDELVVRNTEEYCLGGCGYHLELEEALADELPLAYQRSYDAVREALAPSLTRFMEDTDPSLSGRLDE